MGYVFAMALAIGVFVSQGIKDPLAAKGAVCVSQIHVKMAEHVYLVGLSVIDVRVQVLLQDVIAKLKGKVKLDLN